MLCSLAFTGHAPRALWQGGKRLADGIEETLRWAKRANVSLAFDCDALSLSALAVDSPDVIGLLVEAIVEGRIELVSGAFSSINGMVAGGEANIRNHRMGAITMVRLACSPALTFWPQYFSAYPQMPQILSNCGFESIVLAPKSAGATPEFPIEDESLVAWSGVDGTEIATIARTSTTPNNATRIADAASRAMDNSATTKSLMTWLPSGSDARAASSREAVLEQLGALASNDDFKIVNPRTISMVMQARALEASRRGPNRRTYKSDALWHGQSIGVNGDRILRSCAKLERDILAAESLASMQPFLGKRDAWGAYPHWELDEAWRGLLSAMHSEVREREGSLGGIALADATRAQSLVDDVRDRLERRLARRCPSDRDGSVVLNSLGWPRDVRTADGTTATVPPFGWLALPETTTEDIARGKAERLRMAPEDDHLVLAAGGLRIKLHRKRGVITQIFSDDFPQGLLAPKQELLAFELRNDDGVERFESNVEIRSDIFGVKIEREGKRGKLVIRLEVRTNPSRVVLHLEGRDLPRPGCRPDIDDEYGEGSGASWMRDAFSMPLHAKLGATADCVHDTPYCVDIVDARSPRKRRYPGPGGAAQVEESIRAPFTATSLVDLVEPGSGRGLLYVHDGGQGFLRNRDGARALLSMWDPGIGGPWVGDVDASFAFIPHGPLTHEQRSRLSAEHRSELRVIPGAPGDGQLPDRFSGLRLDGEHALLTAFYREDSRRSELLTDDPLPDALAACEEPWVARVVEVDGVGGVVRLIFPNAVQAAYRCSALGEVLEELPADPRTRNAVLIELRPREIATICFQLA